MSGRMPEGDRGRAGLPPEASRGAHGMARRLVRPVERFLHVEAAGGVVLLIAAAVALAWANSPWAASYEHLLELPVTLGIGSFTFTRSVHFWVNDILMVLFFFVVGLEVRREMHEGQLASLRQAALPIAAAIGGMLLPAAIYVALNAGSPAAGGWGVPMATDIAFAVGILSLLGRRVPSQLRVLLLALAIIDDIGAILVIALFYSSGIRGTGLAVAAAGVVAILAMQRLGIRSPLLYVVPGIVVWAGTLAAGIHPTIAGVVVGLLTPVRSWYGREGFVAEAEGALEDLRAGDGAGADPRGMLPHLGRVEVASREAVSPATRLEAALHPWVAFVVMPVFALANAGVALGGLGGAEAGAGLAALGIGAGLVVGKPLGILLLGWLAVRLGLASRPEGVSWTGLLVVGAAGGIGFTMALFIAALAFEGSPFLAVAKLAILAASVVAGLAALLLGWLLLPAPARQQPARD